MEPDEILDLMRIYENVFFIGTFKPPVTFLSQQHRALNLIWALQENGFDFNEKKIAVIGAGLAGLTATSTAQVLNADVKVFEQSSQPLALQQGNVSRFVLPHLFEWPQLGSLYPRTHLPFLNWAAGSAGAIASELITQWNRVGIPIDSRRKIKRVRLAKRRPTVLFFDKAPPEDFDLIIIASGFGVEESRLADHTVPYWRNEDYDQPILSGDPFKILVSGTGDGGLLDSIRASVENFRHADFLKWLLSDDWVLEHASLIVQKIGDGTSEQQAWNEFLQAEIPQGIRTEIESLQNSGVEVVLGSGYETPFEEDALLSNKIAIALLREVGLITYVRRRLKSIRRINRHKYKVGLVDPTAENNLSETQYFNRVVARHGTKSPLKKLISLSAYDEIKTRWSQEAATETGLPQFNFGILSDRFMNLNMETAFGVIFALGTFKDRNLEDEIQFATLRKIRSVLNWLGRQLGVRNFSQGFGADVFANQTVTITWNDLQCDFSILNGPVETPNGFCGGPLVVAATQSRRILDRLLENDPHRYHQLVYRVTDDALEAQGVGKLFTRNLETGAWVEDFRMENQTIRVTNHLGMFQTHRLFSVQSLLEILRNQWDLAKIHQTGWRANDRAQHIKRTWTI
ncbi:MAG: hypothetical protein SFY67_05135 [Candidatus Melainabacteria bacterium]|nr:hypothetical protein [Candidatus Melainabacteria bacterium]